MATVVRNVDPMVSVIAAAANDIKDTMVAQLRLAQADIATIAADADVAVSPTFAAIGFHNDRSEVTITAADASDLATSLTLCNQILSVYRFHMADTLAHKTTGVALASYTFVTTLAGAITAANDVKSKANTHRASTTFHYSADSTNNITSTNASDLSSLITLLNEIKGDLNAHMASGPAAKSIRVVDA